jgi:hypothetical protein
VYAREAPVLVWRQSNTTRPSWRCVLRPTGVEMIAMKPTDQTQLPGEGEPGCYLANNRCAFCTYNPITNDYRISIYQEGEGYVESMHVPPDDLLDIAMVLIEAVQRRERGGV